MATGNARPKEETKGVLAADDAFRPVPKAPSFGMCEGVRADLEQHGKATDPFTGKVVTRDDVK